MSGRKLGRRTETRTQLVPSPSSRVRQVSTQCGGAIRAPRVAPPSWRQMASCRRSAAIHGAVASPCGSVSDDDDAAPVPGSPATAVRFRSVRRLTCRRNHRRPLRMLPADPVLGAAGTAINSVSEGIGGCLLSATFLAIAPARGRAHVRGRRFDSRSHAEVAKRTPRQLGFGEPTL
jgi:hypothetical protein